MWFGLFLRSTTLRPESYNIKVLERYSTPVLYIPISHSTYPNDCACDTESESGQIAFSRGEGAAITTDNEVGTKSMSPLESQFVTVRTVCL
jgi:hypothetical protein